MEPNIMLVGFSALAVVVGLPVVARRSLFLRRGRVRSDELRGAPGLSPVERLTRRSAPFPRRSGSVCERGISTLEWILLVAAVGGIVTLGILIVRRGYGEAGEQVDGGEAAGQTLALAQADAEEIISADRCGTEPPSGGLRQWSGMFTFSWDATASRCVASHTNIQGDS